MSTLNNYEDKGQADHELLRILIKIRVTEISEIVSYLKKSRLIGAIVAKKDKQVEMNQALFKSNDGRIAMPVFTSIEELYKWDKSARPLPLMAPDFARQVIEQKLDALIIDIGSDHRLVVEGKNLDDLARDETARNVHEDSQIIEIVEDICFKYPQVLKVLVEKGLGCDLKVTLVGREIEPELVILIGKIIAEHEIIREKAPRGTDLFLSQKP